MTGTETPLRQQLADAERRRLEERADGRESIRKLLRVTPELERMRSALDRKPPKLDVVYDRIDSLLCTLADEQTRLTALDAVDRERTAMLPEDRERAD